MPFTDLALAEASLRHLLYCWPCFFYFLFFTYFTPLCYLPLHTLLLCLCIRKRVKLSPFFVLLPDWGTATCWIWFRLSGCMTMSRKYWICLVLVLSTGIQTSLWSMIYYRDECKIICYSWIINHFPEMAEDNNEIFFGIDIRSTFV